MPYDNNKPLSSREKRLAKRTAMNLLEDSVAREVGMTPKKGIPLKKGLVLDMGKSSIEPSTTRNSFRSDADLRRQAKTRLQKKIVKKAAAKVATRAIPIVGTAIAAAEAGYGIGYAAGKAYDTYQNKKTLNMLDKLASKTKKPTKKGSK